MLIVQIISIDLYSQFNRNTKLIDSTEVVELNFKFEHHHKSDTTFSKASYKLDSIGRVISQSHYNTDKVKNKSISYWYNSSNKVIKKLESGYNNFLLSLPDSIITRISYDNEGRITNNIVTTISDSLLWIENFRYHDDDSIVREYYKNPDWIKRLIPEFMKDTTYFDYDNNIKYSISLANDGSNLMSSTGPIKNNDLYSTFDHLGLLIENEKNRNEIKYDMHRNWIYIKTYKITGQHEVLKFVAEREIIYKKK